MKKKVIYFLLFSILGLLLCGLVAAHFIAGEKVYDLLHKNPPVYEYNNARSILNDYRKINATDLPATIRKRFITRSEYEKNEFYVIPKKDRYRKLFLHNRINRFLSGEQRATGITIADKDSVYLCMDQQVLEAAFKTTTILQSKGYNWNAISISSGFRTPDHNDGVKGALNSMHLYGKALDLSIGDINGDLKIDQTDKNIVIQILENQVIGNKGGIGFYPGKQVLHMDIRGRRARWNSYKRK